LGKQSEEDFEERNFTQKEFKERSSKIRKCNFVIFIIFVICNGMLVGYGAEMD
jgi:hypothetical protein